MYLQPQDIILVHNITFKDNQKVDFHQKGRPVLLINTSLDYLYFLTLSTHKPKSSSYQFYPISKQESLLKKDSYINLQNIYKTPTIGYIAIATIPDDIFYDILKCFQYYQEHKKTDILYPEIQEESVEMIRRLKRY